MEIVLTVLLVFLLGDGARRVFESVCGISARKLIVENNI